MTRLVLLFALLPSLAFAENHLMDDHKTMTYDCGKDAATNIMGNGNTITLTGTCDTIKISGNDNKLAGDRAKSINVTGNGNAIAIAVSDAVTVSGNRNKLAWKKASPKDAGPKITNSGNDNKLDGN